MGKKLNLINQRFGRLTVIEEVGKDKNGNILWECLCACKNKTIVNSRDLKNGHTKSCGCLRIEIITTHDMCKTRTYITWQSMIQRCNNVKNTGYPDYGGRGIKVCVRWYKFENFLEDMGERPKDLTIERIDNDKGYYPENCKYASQLEQSRNRRRRKDNKTGVVGISWVKDSRKYCVHLGLNNKGYHIGHFTDLNDAKIARKQAEQRYWR